LQQAATYDYPVKTFRGSGTIINSVGISPDGKTLFTAGDVLQLWDAQTDTATQQLFAAQSLNGGTGSSVVVNAVFSPDGHYILSGGDDNRVR